MADLAADAAQSYNPSASSLLDKLPGKRVDAYIREVTSRGMPQQGMQTGGYTQAHTHLSHIPLFPLYSEEQRKTMVEKWGDSSNLRDFGKQDLGMKEKLTFKAMDHMGGGGQGIGTLSAMKWMGRTVVGLEVMAANMAVEQIQIVVFTRWVVPVRQGVPWFVDVLENRYADPNSKRAKMAKVSGNALLLKPGVGTNDKVTFKLLGMEAKGLKSQKTWSKKRGIESSCDEIVLVAGGVDVDVPLEMGARIQRACSVLEGRETQKRFEDQWMVPLLR
ncbi:hypothetical protein H2200_003934 [Cladophialophora chaetospira]|uniref:Uncharacterized protein n=1 Tax=Cladophialophora chaetospira TaxID=386627 RepID=A0AA39CL76_9EURO|nr:hypothetical protein H2200_003934 [Cladophialophora chaetospira]